MNCNKINGKAAQYGKLGRGWLFFSCTFICRCVSWEQSTLSQWHPSWLLNSASPLRSQFSTKPTNSSCEWNEDTGHFVAPEDSLMCPLTGCHLWQVKEQQVPTFTSLTGAFEHEAIPEAHHFTFTLCTEVSKYSASVCCDKGRCPLLTLRDTEKFWSPLLAFPLRGFCILKITFTVSNSFPFPMFNDKESFHCCRAWE